MIKPSTTPRGYQCMEFTDRSGAKCSIQISSLAMDYAIWLGFNECEPKHMVPGKGWVRYPIHEDVLINTRMELTIDQVKELIPVLQKFVDTGTLY